MTQTDLFSILPIAFLMTWACILLLVGAWLRPERRFWAPILTVVGFVGALVLTLIQIPDAGEQIAAFGGMAILDGFTIFMHVLFIGSGLFGVALAYNYIRRLNRDRPEYYVLLMFSISGMMMMAMAGDLLIVFLALEILSFPLYILSTFALPREESEEAGLKYLLLGSFSSAFIVFGVALVFGSTATTSIAGVVAAIRAGAPLPELVPIGAGLILVALAFKVGAVPFHLWIPDVYHGAPTSLVAFMSVAAKAGGFAGLLRVFITAFPDFADELTPILWGLAALTMIVGNILAIAQVNIKRLLAYSSIAHAGYILMAMVPFGQGNLAQVGVAAALFYLVAYGVTSFAAWGVVIALERVEAGTVGRGSGLLMEDYAGLGRKYPGLAAAMAVAMLSFTGIPPTLGFVGKFYLFRTAVEGGFIGLALVGVITSLISAYYYLRVVIVMYMQDGDPVVHREPLAIFTAKASAVVVVALTVLSAPLFNWASQALLMLFP
jgi:NADH-quinone oxidoreductase subunit N